MTSKSDARKRRKTDRDAKKRLPDGRLPANTELQHYGMGGPRPFYQDEERRCRRCLDPFLFSAEEQRYGYEVRGFQLDSKPNECAPCRHFLRRVRGARMRLTTLLSQPEPWSAEVCAEAAMLLALLGRRERALELHHRARNLLRDRNVPRSAKPFLDAFDQALLRKELVDPPSIDVRRDPARLLDLFVLAYETAAKKQPFSSLGPIEKLLERFDLLEVGAWQRTRGSNLVRERALEALRRPGVALLDGSRIRAALCLLYEASGHWRQVSDFQLGDEELTWIRPMRQALSLDPAEARERLEALLASRAGIA